MKRLLLKILAALAIAAGIFLVFHYDLYTFFIHKEKIIHFLMSFGPFSVLMFVCLQVLQVVVAFIPGEVTGFIGGYLYGPVLGTIYSMIGLAIGSWLAFVLSGAFGMPFIERFVNPQIIRRYDFFMEHQGMFISFLLFFIPGFPKDALCYILGLSHMKTTTFLVISLTGRLLGTVLLSLQGSYVRKDQDLGFFIILAITGLIFLVGYFSVEKRLKEFRKKRRELRELPLRTSGGLDNPQS
jgi:uncharacterized membrane protein YdjX (TVP38/TMEM64 family)